MIENYSEYKVYKLLRSMAKKYKARHDKDRWHQLGSVITHIKEFTPEQLEMILEHNRKFLRLDENFEEIKPTCSAGA